MTPLSRRVRAYFAPVARGSETPAIFDPAQQPLFALDSPPAPWLDLGWIENFQRSAATTTISINGGVKNAPAALARKNLSARVELDFCQWGKLQMALAAGAQHMNLLAVSAGATASPSGGYPPIAAVPLLPGSTASQLNMTTANAALFSPQDLIAVDVDYAGQTGYVGSGIAAAYVKSASDVRSDANYIRRITFNLGRVASVTSSAINLAQPLIGGAPLSGAGAQKVLGFVDREGGSFFQEWSALFALPEESGGRVCFYYPRLQAVAPAAESEFKLQDPLRGWALHAAFAALPFADANDNEPALCYRSYFPAAGAAIY